MKINKKAALATIKFWLFIIAMVLVFLLCFKYPDIALPFLLTVWFIFVTHCVYKMYERSL